MNAGSELLCIYFKKATILRLVRSIGGIWVAKKKIGNQSLYFENTPYFIGWGNIVGKKEGEGPLGAYFDQIVEDAMYGGQNWEEAEGNLQKKAAEIALQRAGVTAKEVGYLVAGDLQAQLTASTFGIMQMEIPMFGVYGACSTMGESLGLASILVESNCSEIVMALTSSHTEVAERQFRFPLPYGNQKPLCATWTVTGSGAVILGKQKRGKGPHIRVRGITTGKIVDYGIKDSMNMGACMAPAACQVIASHFEDFQTDPKSYDKVITGDLGYVGQRILLDMLKEKNLNLDSIHMDCGIEIYANREQDVHAGGSGCGCSATVLTGYIVQQFLKKKWKRVLFVPTGALLSKVSYNEGKTVPGIAHGVLLEREDE